jgi:anthranilate/para-aminobenzoate synthase component I
MKDAAACSRKAASGVLRCAVHCRTRPVASSLAALSETFSRLAWPSILGANEAKAHADGFSYWAAEPLEVVEIGAGEADPLGRMQQAVDVYQRDEGHSGLLPDGMFCGGWIGFLSYDLGRKIEPRPGRNLAEDWAAPLARLAFYDRFVAYDHHCDRLWLVALDVPGDGQDPREKLDRLDRLVDQSGAVHPAAQHPADIEHVDITKVESNMGRAQYLAAVRRVQQHIVDGDVYQVNLSQRLARPFIARPIDLFHWQSRFNPCPYAAYLDAPGFQVVSASPEMFLTIGKGVIRTKPIKGTRPRLALTGEQAELANEKARIELVASEKEQAELAMIVDVERNDLARICVPGTRQVLIPRTIEAHPSVFHAVAVVQGSLLPDLRFRDVLSATFPGGSITGAPKIRAMEIIDDLEPSSRGVYTGSIGFIGIDGTACLNIAIRTIIITQRTAYVQVGGGIVADSEPQAEYEETLVKARALLAGIEQVSSLEP